MRKNLKAFLVFLPAFFLSNHIHAVETKKPNILVIVADDLGYSDIEPFGGEISTPNLRKMAKEGSTLTDFYAGPTCSVTRSMLLTGNDNHQAGLGTMAELMQPEHKGKLGYEGHLNQKVMTLAEILKGSGYFSLITGKWHLGKTVNSQPSARGFDRSYTLIPGGGSHVDMSPMFPSNYKALYLENGKETAPPENFYSSDFFTDKFLSYLKNDRQVNQPFFGYLAYTAPHWPLQAPDQYLKKYENYYKEGYEKTRQARLERMIKLGIMPKGTQINNPLVGALPAWNELTESQKQNQVKTMQIYAAMVDNLDHNIGRVISYLKEINELDNTFILFISDNGAEGGSPKALGISAFKDGIQDWVDNNFDNSINNMGRKGSYVTLGPQWAQVSSTPLPYFKGLLNSGGIKVPAIARYPKLIQAGKIQHETLHVTDFVPTVLEMTGAIRPGTFNNEKLIPLEGKSFVSIFKNKKMPSRTLAWEFNNRKAVHKGDWVAEFQVKPFGTGEWQLYNKKKDPTLITDLAKTRSLKVAELKADWENYAKRVGVVQAPIRFTYGEIACLFEQCMTAERK